MKISIVTVVFNDAGHIGDTIRNIIGQTAYADIEYIIIDGNSTDGTINVIQKYREKIARVISENDNGIYDAMNKGLKIATGDYVMFINSGDRLTDSNTIKHIIQSIGRSRPDVIYGDYREMVNGVAGTIIPSRTSSKIWYGPVASHQSTLYSLAFLQKNNLFYDLSYRIAADYKLTAQAIRLAKRNVMRIPLCISDFDCSGVSSTNQGQGLREANRVRQEVFGWHPLAISLLSLVHIGARLTKRYCNPVYSFLRH